MTSALLHGLGPKRSAQLVDRIEALFGLHFEPQRAAELARALERGADELGFSSSLECCEAVLADALQPRQLDVIAAQLTVGETYFYRDPRIFALLEQDIFPELLRTRGEGQRHLRLWSAGCCTGEEAYSLAIALHRVLPDPGDWRITILATDVNPAFLAKAERGIYRNWSFRSAPSWLRRDHFRPTPGGDLEIDPAIRRMVTFEPLNLVEDSYPSPLTNTTGMDVVLCRNVLIYFNARRAHAVVERLRQALRPGGFLFVGAAEAQRSLLAEFEVSHRQGVICYRKHSSSTPEGCRTPLPTGAPASRKAPTFLPAAQTPSPPSSRTRASGPNPAAVPRDDVSPPGASQPPDDESDGVDRLRTARQLADDGDLQAALHTVTEVVQQDRTALDAYLLRASVLQALGRPAESYEDLKRCLYLQPEHLLACVLGAHAAHRMGAAKRARALQRTASRLLEARSDAEVPADAEGMTVGQLRRMLHTVADPSTHAATNQL